MIDAIDVELRERFAALVDDADDSDWFEVRPPQRSLRALVIAAALALTVAVAAPAVGLPHRIVRLFSDAKPAPSPVAKAFAGFDQLTGTDPAAIPREVLTTRTGPGRDRTSAKGDIPPTPRPRIWTIMPWPMTSFPSRRCMRT